MADKARKTSARRGEEQAPARMKASGKARRTGKKKRGRVGRILKGVTIFALAVMLVVTLAGIWFYQTTKMPDPNAEFTTQTTTLYFNDGTTELGQLSVQNRTVLSYEEMPQVVKDAVVAAEDRTFWTNSGIDIKGMLRAFYRIARGDDIQGGSTITQQYIKILYLTSDQTVSRKLRELVLANKLNKDESKEDVLEGYLNTIYFGRSAYGIEAAAEAYFGIHASELSVAQAVVLAAVINSPSYFDPYQDPEAEVRLLERYNYILDGMRDSMHTITEEDYQANYNTLPAINDPVIENVYGGPGGFLIQMATDELRAAGFTDDQIQGGGLQITTTFDPILQQAAIDAAQATVAEAVENARPLADGSQPSAEDLHVGLASIDNNTGEVLALYGGPDYLTNSINWATTPRFAASTFKVYGIIAGLRNGFGLTSMFQGSTFTPTGDDVPVSNDSNAQYPPMDLRQATVYSANTAFVDLITRIPNGYAALVKAANDAGVPENGTWEQQGNRLVLGGGEVSALDNAGGFATLATAGHRLPHHVVREVIDPSGNVVYSADVTGTQAIENAVARDTTSALTGVPVGSSQNAVHGCQVAAKTGTEGVMVGQEGIAETVTRAGWMVGYTRQITTAVLMVAGESGLENLDVYAPGGTFYGATYPTDVWDAYMTAAMAGRPCQNFDPPANIQPTVANTLFSPTPTPSVSETATPTEQPTTGQVTEAPAQPSVPTLNPTETGAAPSIDEPTIPEPEPEPSNSSSAGG